MAFTLDQFAALRPLLYHVTARENLPQLRRRGRMETARELLRGSGREDLVRTRRRDAVPVTLGGDVVVLKDQSPLVEANLTLSKGWRLQDFVEYLNSHVYFWPGNAAGMVGPGKRLLSSYAPKSPLVLRVPFHALVHSNPDVPPLFSSCNSGAPRMQRGTPAKRGPDLFKSAEQSKIRRYEVVEVAFRGGLVLPSQTCLVGAGGTWVPLADLT